MSWFSPDEKLELARLAQYHDRKEYILVHAFLKKVLERYIHLPPDQIRFESQQNGKPFLKCNHTHPPLYFSLSYRNEYALLAVSGEPCFGVDVEEVKQVENLIPFLVAHFSKREREIILAEKTEANQLSMLFTLWTMKEALVKALGTGLSDTIRKYEVLPFLKEPLGDPVSDLSNQWCVDQIPIAKNYKAALALRSKIVNRKVFEYNPEVVIS